MLLFQDMLAYLENALLSFVNDPADSDYQRGYEAALKDVEEEWHRIHDAHFPVFGAENT